MHEAGSIAGIDGWREIAPDRHNDWIGQRSDEFQKLYPMGSKAAKAGRMDEAIFKLYSNGYETSRDANVYNFSQDACAGDARKMVDDHLGALQELKESRAEALDLEEIVSRHSSNLRWDQALKDNVRRRKEVFHSMENIWMTQYRPFLKQRCYVDSVLVNRKYQMDSIFSAAAGQHADSSAQRADTKFCVLSRELSRSARSASAAASGSRSKRIYRFGKSLGLRKEGELIILPPFLYDVPNRPRL